MTGTALMCAYEHDGPYRSFDRQLLVIKTMAQYGARMMLTEVFREWMHESQHISPIVLMDNPELQYRYYQVRKSSHSLWLGLEAHYMREMDKLAAREEHGLYNRQDAKDLLNEINYNIFCSDVLNATQKWGIPLTKEFQKRLTYFKLTVQ